MNRALKYKYIIVIFIISMVFSSCSILRGRKCNCPQWSKENPVVPEETNYPDAEQA